MPSMLMLVSAGAALMAAAAVFYALRVSSAARPAGPRPPAESRPPPVPPSRPVQPAWSIADDEEDAIPTSIFRATDDPELAAFLAEERTVEDSDPGRLVGR